MSRVERVAAHVGQINALLQCIINECDAAQTEVFDYLYMSDAANEQSEKLKAENERLHSCLTDAAENRRLVMGEYKQLREENAKLRELAEKAWKTAERLCQAFDGPCRDDGTTIYKPCPLGERNEECVYGLIQRDLRELGVEV